MTPYELWVLQGSKPGDNSQVLRLAEASGLRYLVKPIVLKPGFEKAKPRVRASLHHIDRERSAELVPPWPRAVLVAGRRLAMVALWIREQSRGATKLALIGAPKAEADKFGLIIVPVQYQVAEGPNVCRIGLPLLGIPPAQIAREGVKYSEALSRMPRPLTVLLAGGSTSSLILDPQTASDIIRQIRETCANEAGSLFVTTSRRTPPDSARAMAASLHPQDRLHVWRKGDPDNPLMGLLLHGDRFVVTEDSMSMLVEVARLGKPLAIAPLRYANREVAGVLNRLHVPQGAVNRISSWAAQLINLVSGPSSRDFKRLHDYMFDRGMAVPLGRPFAPVHAPPPDDILIAAERLRNLFNGGAK
jgi:hypothetical protein